MLDLLVKNGLTYVDGVFKKCDVGVKDGKIACVAECGILGEAKRVIEAEGKYVIPGGIDTHVHIRSPGHDDREDFYTGTMSAAQGGCTTILEHPISTPPQYNKEILDNRKNIARDKCVVDYAFYGAAGGEFPEEITEIAKEGIVAYKSFLHQAPEGREKEFVGLTMANDAEILVGMREIAKTGLMMASHAENNDLITYNIAKMRAEGHTKPLDHCKSRPPITEYSTVAKLIMFAKETGCTLELAHMSTVESMELARKARFEGQKVFVETCPHYLLLDETALEKYGPFARCNPPLRPKETVEKLWDYVNDGTIDFIGSDHGPFLLSEKEQGNEDIFKAFCGAPGVDLRLPLMLDAAARGKTTIERVVELLCVNPARCFNIYPQKGTISAGADADLVVFDMNDTTVVDRNKSYSKARETARIFDGWELGCKLNYTVVRGRVLMEDGVVDPDCAGYGQLVTPQK
ncbi:L-hydantoinase [uncultured Flavonifractor sp.]|nr:MULTISPECIES: allantoinase AllB [Eubacteriales]SCH67365.1 L-hydantoinase [uncultured Clostridium sp.]SCI56220.1 L-hydantoinase [uncultured Flavonifractor sp.]MCH1979265.1 allantoinase AllB [Lawsonibacter sp. OA9]MCU6703903.1 allantoinase AllB [Muriventricola aceti]SCJ63409.1 L-hydantoinase [uncultured Flavonifractor sp.]